LGRREFLKKVAAGAVAATTAGRLLRGGAAQAGTEPPKYKRADFSILTKGGYGVGFHWLPYTWSRKYPPFDWKNNRKESIRNHHKSVEEFDVKYCAEQVQSTGAGHVLFTLSQVYHLLCCPCEPFDKVCPGLTSERDLIMDIADELGKYDIKLMGYYCQAVRNVAWHEACGLDDKDKTKLVRTISDVWSCLGERYKDKLIGWWFDHGRFYRGVARQHRGDWTWHQFAQAAKAGFPGRLITYNGGVENINPMTERQDMWAGELTCVNYVPRGTLATNLPWYSFVEWHCGPYAKISGSWMMRPDVEKRPFPSPSAETIAGFYQRFKAVGGTVTYNLLIDREGNIYVKDLKLMAEVRRIIRGE
jgi:hypothetical protein